MPWRTSFSNTVITPLPADIDPRAVVNLLHDHHYLIHTQPIVTRSTPRDPDAATGAVTYDVWERIALLPFGWWQHEIHFTAGFRDIAAGVESRIDAPMGFVSRATYAVRTRELADDDDDDEGADAEARLALAGATGPLGDWVLEERITTECNLIFKWFVQGTMVPVRRKMHAGMISRLRGQVPWEMRVSSEEAV